MKSKCLHNEIWLAFIWIIEDILFGALKNNKFLPFFQELHIHPKADKSVKGQVGAPMPGTVMEIRVKEGDSVEKGEPLVVLSAMKMEMVVQAPIAGKVKSLSASVGMKLEGEDLVLTLE